jgi:choline kinase
MTPVVIAAAGIGSRLNSVIPKPLFPVCGEPNIGRLLRAISKVGLPVSIVLGHRAHDIKNYIEGLEFDLDIVYYLNSEYKLNSPMSSYKFGATIAQESFGDSNDLSIIICADLVISELNLIQFLTLANTKKLAGVSVIRTKTGLGINTDTKGLITEIDTNTNLKFEWGNFASVSTSKLLRSDEKLLSSFVKQNLPYASFITECIDIDTPDDVIIAESLISQIL